MRAFDAEAETQALAAFLLPPELRLCVREVVHLDLVPRAEAFLDVLVLIAEKMEQISPTPVLDDLEYAFASRADLSLGRNREFFRRFRKRWVIKLGKIAAKKVI